MLNAVSPITVIMGIDPGSRKYGTAILLTNTSGLCAWEGLELVKVRGNTFGERLAFIEERARASLEYWQPDFTIWEAAWSHAGKGADAGLQLAKAVGVWERLMPSYACVQEAYEAQPSSSRKLVGTGLGRNPYPLLRVRLAELYPRIAPRLQADEVYHDEQFKPEVGDDVISAMVQAHALFQYRQTLATGEPAQKGIERVYAPTAPSRPRRAPRRSG